MTPIEQLRLMIGDNDPNKYEFTDEQLQFYIDSFGGNVFRSAAFIWGLKAANAYSKMTTSSMSRMSVGAQSYEYRQMDADYQAALNMQKYFEGLANTNSLGSIKIVKARRNNIYSTLEGC